MKLSIALLAAPAVAFAPQAQQAASVKLEAHKEVAAATLAAGALLAPFAAFAGDIESGETLFAGNCAACHAGGNNVIAAEKTLRKEALDKYRRRPQGVVRRHPGDQRQECHARVWRPPLGRGDR